MHNNIDVWGCMKILEGGGEIYCSNTVKPYLMSVKVFWMPRVHFSQVVLNKIVKGGGGGLVGRGPDLQCFVAGNFFIHGLVIMTCDKKYFPFRWPFNGVKF